MQLAFHIALQVLGFITVGAFLPGFVLNFYLFQHDQRLQKERAEPPGFRLLPKQWPAPTADDYPPEVRRYWIIRDRCMKTFAICIGLIAILAVVAAIADIPFDLK